MEEADRSTRIRRRLRIVRYVGAVDLVLLVALVASSLSGNRELVRILGPIHGGTFLLLLTLTITAASDGYWSWWFPIGIALTGGPIGALVGEWLIGRRLEQQIIAAHHRAGVLTARPSSDTDPAPDELSSPPGASGHAPDAQQERVV